MDHRMVARRGLFAGLLLLSLSACGTFADLDDVSFQGGGDAGFDDVEPGAPVVQCPPEGPCVVQLASSSEAHHTCARMSDGTVRCWGNNQWAQVGDPQRQIFSRTPQPVVGVDGVTQIGGGRYHTCALTSPQTVLCWGGNGAGELGNMSHTTSTPVPVERLRALDIDQLVVGATHSCVRQGGEVSCWGQNDYGQLGSPVGYSSATPMQVTLPADAVQIWAGGLNTCALLDDGRLMCWGANGYGQLGSAADEEVCSDPCAITPVEVPGVVGATGVALSRTHTCAAIEGALSCWGDNEYGQLGTEAGPSRATPEVVAGIADVEEVAAGLHFTCARVTGGDVYCWGLGDAGQGGDNAFLSRSAPTRLPTLTGATRLVAGIGHVCAVHGEGEVSCWGSSYRGQTTSSQANQGLPWPVSLTGPALSLATGETWTCAILESGAWCWGEDEAGQLGTGVPLFQRAPFVVPGLDHVAQVAVGTDSSCARTAEGEVLCWGNNETGQLGVGGDEPDPEPARVVLPAPAVGLASAGQTWCAVTTEHKLHCWGGNPYNSLGDPSGDASNVPREIFDLPPVEAVWGGIFAYCARMVDGTARCWGNDEGSKLGFDGEADDCGGTPCVPTPTEVPALDGLRAWGSGWAFGCARFDSGEVRCAGLNEVGELGVGTFDASPLPTPVPELEAVRLAVAGGHSCAVTRGGPVRCWGWGEYGRLGSTTPLPQCDGACAWSPVEVRNLPDAVDVVCGEYHCCALRQGGGVRCWGANWDGQVARPGTTPWFEQPVDVSFD